MFFFFIHRRVSYVEIGLEVLSKFSQDKLIFALILAFSLSCCGLMWSVNVSHPDVRMDNRWT